MSDGESAAKRLGQRRLFLRSIVAIVSVLVVISIGWMVLSSVLAEQSKFEAVKADFATTWCATYGENPRNLAAASDSWLGFVERNRDFLEQNSSRLGVTSTSLDGETTKTTWMEETIESYGDGFAHSSFWSAGVFQAHFEFFDFPGGPKAPPDC